MKNNIPKSKHLGKPASLPVLILAGFHVHLKGGII